MAGRGIGAAVLDHAIRRSERGESTLDAAVNAIGDALLDWAARGARSVEEHYCRQSAAPRAVKVRTRIEQGIGDSNAGIEGLSRRLLKIDAGPPARAEIAFSSSMSESGRAS